MADELMTHLLQQSLDQNEHLATPPTGELIVRLLQRSIEQTEHLLAEQIELRTSLTNHILNEETLVKGLSGAFPKKPDGSPDFEGHEIFHSTLITESRARTQFYRELRQDLVKKGLWGLVMILVALVTYWWSGQMRGGH